MTTLTPCKSCHRHCKVSEKSCPFCGVRRLAVVAGAAAIATLAIACDGPAAQTPSSNVVIPQPTACASSSSPSAPYDAGSAATTPTTAPTTSAPDDVYRAVPAYGMPPPRLPDGNH